MKTRPTIDIKGYSNIICILSLHSCTRKWWDKTRLTRDNAAVKNLIKLFPHLIRPPTFRNFQNVHNSYLTNREPGIQSCRTGNLKFAIVWRKKFLYRQQFTCTRNSFFNWVYIDRLKIHCTWYYMQPSLVVFDLFILNICGLSGSNIKNYPLFFLEIKLSYFSAIFRIFRRKAYNNSFRERDNKDGLALRRFVNVIKKTCRRQSYSRKSRC